MEKVQLANTGQMVSVLCSGALYYGTKIDKQTSYALLDAFLDAGGNFIDTANMYAHWIAEHFKGGESEAVLGQWMKDRKSRNNVFLSSKMGISYVGVENGLKPKQVFEECHKSLKRLQTDYIDLYFAHADDFTVPMEDYLEAFNRLVEQGKVRCIGASNFENWRFTESRLLSKARGWADFKVIQNRYSYLRPKLGWKNGLQRHLTQDMIDYCSYNNIAIMGYSAQLGGYYANPNKEIEEGYLGADFSNREATLEAVARECNTTKITVALAWLIQGKPSIIPVFASSNLEQLNESLRCLNVKFSDEQINRMNNAGGWSS
ncbi:1-deoxyxylulose-5-phosphate synthase YajO [subsurface metagenome]